MATDTLRDTPALRAAKSLVFTLVGVGLMISAGWWAVSTRQFVARAASAPGLVVRLNHGGAHPEVRFTTATGEAVEYGQGGMIWGYRVGDRVEVLYAPEHPGRDPVIHTAGALWGFVAMVFFMGAGFVLMAQLAWWRLDRVG